ncbi:subtilisin-like protein [Thozetella sp. PMI_491]|nr:subtilisin-like protein [Thozetella sp. PMI_491]
MNRRRCLLQFLLPSFTDGAAGIYARTKRRKDKAFWASFVTPCFLLRSSDYALHALDAEHDELVYQLLEYLDKAVVIEKADMAQKYSSLVFPHLETLRQLIKAATSDDEEQLAEGWTLVKPEDELRCNDLVNLLNQLAEATRDSSKQPLPEDAESATPPLRSSIAPAITQLFSTIAKYFQCSNSYPRLGLAVRGSILHQVDTLDKESSGYEQAELISLEEGLITNPAELAINIKTCLAVVLSYSMLDFCGEAWFPLGWTKRGIKLLQHSGRLFLRPALVTSFRQHPITPELPNVSRNKELLLLHAIVLMEVFEQEALPIHIGNSSPGNIEELHAKVRELFDHIKWGVSEGFRQAVEACIDGFPKRHPEADENPDRIFEESFCRCIIQPLERDFVSIWGKKDPDQVLTAEGYLPSIQRIKPTPPPKDPRLKYHKGKPRPPISNTSMSVLPSPAAYCPIASRHGTSELKFFDVDDGIDHRQIKGSLTWFNSFECARAQIAEKDKQKPGRRAQILGKGIKVAILDTGIDLSNSWMSSKRNRIQCWPRIDSCHDSDGHGTQVAYLLLRLAPLVQLRVAKVSSSQLLKDVAEIEEIAKAIRHFSSDEGDRVDMINLSFGFPRYSNELQPIREAIRFARANGVLIFAAAGNDGGNQRTFWPAILDDVIDIHATDSNGKASTFTPADGDRHICTLGEALPSCEEHPDNAEQNVHRSGTSFSVPIAVATAAIVLGFMDHAAELSAEERGGPDDSEALRPRLRTRTGMENVLRKTCVLQGATNNAGFSYIAPWFFLGIEESSRVGIIRNELWNSAE